MIRTFAALVALLTLPAHAQTVRDCDSWEANARNIVWEGGTRTFANGEIRFIALDTGGEPACCSYHVMVTFPDPELGFQTCALVSGTGGGAQGFAGVDLTAATARYNPASGLTVRVPVAIYDGAEARPARVAITVNRATGRVSAR